MPLLARTRIKAVDLPIHVIYKIKILKIFFCKVWAFIGHVLIFRFEQQGVKFIKRPNDGKMKGLAFIQDPDGYWIEIFTSNVV